MHLRPHRSIIEEGALAPLHHRFRIKIVAAGELLDRSLRSLYSSSDGVRGLGAAVKNLSHRASRNVASAWLIPRHSGTAHLVFVLLQMLAAARMFVAFCLDELLATDRLRLCQDACHRQRVVAHRTESLIVVRYLCHQSIFQSTLWKKVCRSEKELRA